MKDNHGVSLVELLIVMALAGIVLGVLTAFFQTQVQTSNALQSQDEVRTKVRGLAEIMMQDLQLAGSRAVYKDGSVSYHDPASSPPASDSDTWSEDEWQAYRLTQCSSVYRHGCVRVNPSGADLRVYYATSLDRGTSSACRRVDYLLDSDGDLGEAGVIYRRDVACGDTSTSYDAFAFAGGIDDVSVGFICHDPDNTVSDIADCYSESTYPREATVQIAGHAERARDTIESTVQLSTSLPNLRPPVDYLDLEE